MTPRATPGPLALPAAERRARLWGAARRTRLARHAIVAAPLAVWLLLVVFPALFAARGASPRALAHAAAAYAGREAVPYLRSCPAPLLLTLLFSLGLGRVLLVVLAIPFGRAMEKRIGAIPAEPNGNSSVTREGVRGDASESQDLPDGAVGKGRRAKERPWGSIAARTAQGALLSGALVVESIGAASFVLLARGAQKEVVWTWAFAVTPDRRDSQEQRVRSERGLMVFAPSEPAGTVARAVARAVQSGARGRRVGSAGQ